MNKVIKSNSYIPMNDKLFQLPLPCSFEVLDEDRVLYQCKVNSDRSVRVKNIFNPYYRRETPFTFTDIHYFFRSRINPAQMNPAENSDIYSVIRATHGILPFDRIWIRFEGETLTYKQLTEEKGSEPDENQINEILHQHSVDVSRISHEAGADNGQN